MNKQLTRLWRFVGFLYIVACSRVDPAATPTSCPEANLEVPPESATELADRPVVRPVTTTTPSPRLEPPPDQPAAGQATPPGTDAPQGPTESPSPALATLSPNRPAPLQIDEIVAALARLPFDDFLEESYKQLLLRSPRKLTGLGLSASFGLRDDKLDDLSAGYVLETQRLELAVLGILRGYNRAEYTREQQVSFDVCEWYLDNQVRGREFTLHANPLNHFVNGYIFQLNDLLTDLHPLEHRQNAEDYIARLSQVNDQVSQLLAGMGHREAMGHVPPDFILRMTRQEISRSLGTSTPTAGTIRAPLLTVYTTLSDALQEMDDLTDEEKNALCEATLHQIRDAFIPAYLDLLSAIDRLLPLASSDASVWSLPEGETFYAFALRQETSIELTPEQVHQMGLAEVERIQAEMRLLFDELGYPQDRPVGELIRRAIAEGGTVDSSQIISANQALIAEIDERVQTIFDLRTRAPAVVIAEPAFGGYDTPASADSSRPAALHASGGTSGANRAEMPTIAYHEAIPGHHFQIALTQEMELPIFRKHAFFNAHGEGWALYAERLACELGVCEDDPYGDLGGLRLKLFRAVRLVVDTGIHAKRWTREVERYVAWPAQATGYQIGMMKILELRQRAMDQLGDHCDLKEFHNVVLGNGVLPLTILEALVNEYIADRQ